MNTAFYIIIWFWIIFFIIIPQQNHKKFIISKKLLNKKKESKIMIELAKKFLDKECIIYLLNGQTIGTIKEVTNGGIFVENKTEKTIINIEYILRIKEYPTKKNGKKKSIVLD